jgi:3-oxoacyl-[acyl-carrier protein] reductase
VSQQTAVITGGAGGLARAICRVLLDRGWKVHAPPREELDVRVPERIDAWFGAVGVVDLLVNNAGVTRDAPFLRLDEADWDEVIDTNLKGAFWCSRAAALGMIERRSGHIVQIGSFSALRPPAGQAAYASAKAGLIGLTQALAQEWGGGNLRVNCILPGFLETRMTSALSTAVVSATRNAHGLKRFNEPSDVGQFIVELHEQGNVSGQVFQLDSRMRRW